MTVADASVGKTGRCVKCNRPIRITRSRLSSLSDQISHSRKSRQESHSSTLGRMFASLKASMLRVSGTTDGASGSTDVVAQRKPSREDRQGQPAELRLENVRYVPLPPSPACWDLRRQKEEASTIARHEPHIAAVLDAYSEKKYNKVVSLIDTVPKADLHGVVGEAFLKSYRSIILRWRKKEKPHIALKWSAQMMDRLSELVNDTDRRRHNKLVDALESGGIGHEYCKYETAGSARDREPLTRIPEWCDWEVQSEAPLPMPERPDPAFRDTFSTLDGCLTFDMKGRSERVPQGKAAVQKRNRAGDTLREAALSHDIYRLGVNPLGCGFVALSSDCGLHAYDQNLALIFTKDLRAICANRNYIRCTDVSPAMDRFLCTVVDQAWCLSTGGEELWSVKTPPKEGWEKVVERVETFGTSEEIMGALEFMGLSFPFSAEGVKSRYRKLAKEWHPDLHPGEPVMHERMVKLNNAVEVLTGTEAASIMKQESEVVYYKQVIRRERLTVPGVGGIELEMAMYGPGEDWIYAASFDHQGKHAYLGTYAGKIVQLDDVGNPLRVFDIGSVPTTIVDNGSYLYILTDTRLYVLRDETLVRLVDVFEKGRLLMTETGFGLLAAKSLRWFDEDGSLAGAVETRDPIRLVYSTTTGITVETRQHRIQIAGAPIWWRVRDENEIAVE